MEAIEHLSGYPLIEKIEDNRGAIIFRSTHKKTNIPVLISQLKLIKTNPSEIAEFKQEFQAVIKKSCLGVITFLDIIEEKNGISLVMEHFKGTKVSQLISNTRLTLDVFLDIAIRLAQTLGELHQEDVIHRAVTPDHILVNIMNGEVKLSGFGFIAQLTHENDALYDPEVIKQTLSYISPEQTGRMNRPIDYRTDLYSLGISLYHMITGERPFNVDNPMGMFHSHIALSPKVPTEIVPDLPQVISNIIMRLISKNPEERYQNSFGLKADLETCRDRLKSSGTISSFTLGLHDISRRFNIPQKLYGRSSEISQLLSCYDKVCLGEKSILLIGGYPGIGKTALTRELDKSIVEKQGYFISGKYEQLRKDVPLSALIQAVMALVRDMLSESHRKISVWKDLILNAVGSKGQLLTNMIPDIALIIGEQPDVPALDSEENKNRFNFVFMRFLEAIGRPDHPVALFLDDLQWADLPSLELIERIATSPSIRHLFIIGSYRDNEVSSSHPLNEVISSIEKQGIPIERIFLKPLLEQDVKQLIVDFLKSSHEQGTLLADLVYEKTGGNPFFVTQFLKNLFEMNHITFDPVNGWQWDTIKLKEMKVTDNLVDLLIDKINRLSPETREVLKICACIGNRFDLDMIALMQEKSIDQVLPGIREAINEGLIGRTSRNYVFHHDRIQEAAYSLIPDQDKALYHYRVGRLEWKRNSSEDIQNKLFYIVDQLKAGLEYIRTPQEIRDFTRMCLDAGKKAKSSAAYAHASQYLKTGMALLSPDTWDKEYQLTYDFHHEMLECLYLTGYFEEAEKLFTTTLDKAKSNIDIANLSVLMIILYTSQGDYEKALKTGYQGATIVGQPFPERSSELRVALALLKLLITFRKNKIEDVLNFPDSQDPAILSYGYLVIHTGTVVYYRNPNLFALMALEGNRITLKNGKWEYADFGYNALGCVVGSSLGLFKHGYRFGQMALALSEQKPGKNNRCRINFLFGMMILPWTKHARGSIDYFRKAYKLGLECGDFIFSAHSINLLCMYRIILGHPLDEIMSEYESYHDFQTKGKDPFVRRNYIENIQMLRCLDGRTPKRGRMDDDSFNEQENLDFYIRENNKLGLFYFLLDQLRIRYLFGDYTEALSTAEEVLKLIRTNVGLGCLHNGDILLYHSLTLTALYPQKGFLEKIRMMTRLRLNQIKMSIWAKNSPDNFRHKYLLVDAEIKRIKHRHFKAATTYRDALRSASQSGYLQHEALANELYAGFYLSASHTESASYFYTEACRCYQLFGARAKVAQIREAHPDLIHKPLLIPDTSSKKTSDILDLATVVKASQDISGEIYLGKLLTAMLNTTMENAGAERGFLILEQNGNLVVEAEGNMGTREITLLQSLPLDDHDGLSKAIVNYTARTREPLILNNASTTGDFTRDPYVLKNQPKSILCLPILRQGNLSAIIYFENNLTASAFKEERLEILKILSSQAAISIDNARLYENMEEKVRTRTIELNQTLQKVEEINHRIMASITYASLIQQSLLPDPEIIRTCLPASFFIWQPRDIIGGDIYHIESFETGFVLTIIDCTGHGVPGAFMTMLAVSGLRRIIHEDKEYNPSLILKKLNVFVKSSLKQDKPNAQSNDGLDAAVITYHKDSQSLDFAAARLALYVVKNHELTILKGDKQSVGYVRSDTEYTYRLHTLHDLESSCYYIATDGFSDQLGSTPKRRFGSNAFFNLITNHHDKPFDQQQEILLQALARHKGMEPYTDDITMVGFRIGG